MADDEDPPHRNPYAYTGIVTDNTDANKRGVVMVRVPNVLEPAAEARVAMPGSPFSNGMYVIPAVGSEVLVMFDRGEYDAPVVLGGFVPPVLPEGSRTNLPAADLVDVITLENKDFRVILGHHKSELVPYFEISSRPDANGDSFRFTLDLSSFLALLTAPAYIDINTKGLLNLNGRLMQLRDRPVTEGTEPI